MAEDKLESISSMGRISNGGNYKSRIIIIKKISMHHLKVGNLRWWKWIR